LKNKILITIFLSVLLCSNLDEIRSEYNNGLYDIAYKNIVEFITTNNSDPNGFALASKIVLSLDSLGKSNEYLTKAIDLDKTNEDFRKQWQNLDSLRVSLKEANRKLDSGLISEAITLYERIIDKNPNLAMSYFRLGRIYYSENNLEDAVYYFRKAVDINPFNSTYNNYITNIAKKLAKEGNNIYRRKDYDNAITKYIQSTKIDPSYTEAFYRASKAYYMLGDYESAKWNLESGLKSNSTHVQSLKLLGDIDSKEGNYEKALDWYLKSVEANSNYHIAHYALGKTYYKLQNYTSALSSLKNTILIDPTYSKAYELTGIIEKTNGNLENAITNFKLAVEYDEKAYVVNYRLASALNEIGDYSEAKKAAKACIDIKRKYAAAWYELGIAEKQLGNKAASKIAFKEASKDRKWKESALYEIKMLEKGS
tara:strand:- start:10 stop:1284 length:1275 start_codon:yes stop_codon:yes gene_type:complete